MDSHSIDGFANGHATPPAPWDLSNISKYRFFVCPEPICQFMCQNESRFRTHMKEFHVVIEENDIKIEDLDTENLNLLVPDLTAKRLEQLNKYNIELVVKNQNNVSEIEKISKISSNFDLSVKCTQCGFLFYSILELRDHLKDEHPELTKNQTQNNQTTRKSARISKNNNGNYFENFVFSDEDFSNSISEPEDISIFGQEYIPTTEIQNDENLTDDEEKFANCFENNEQVGPGDQQQSSKGKIITKVRCKYCSNDYRSYFYLKNHSEREHPDEPLSFTKRILKRIDENLNSEEILIKETDGDVTTYKCDHCDYITTHQDLRGMHMQREHNDASKIVWFKCDLCDFKCKTRKTIGKHKKDHKKGIIGSKHVVFKIMPNSNTLTFGKLENKISEDLDVLQETDRKIRPTVVLLLCQICPEQKEFRNFHYLRAHFERHHPESKLNFKKKIIKGNDGLEEMLADDDSEGQIYKCVHCEFISHLSDLRGLHMEKEHNDPSKLVFVKCDKCEYTSKSRGSLVNHKRIVHENYRPKKCDFPNCEKRFPTKSCLEDHIMRVHSANEILCNDCGKLFASPSMLRRHARWHHNPDKVGGPLPCHICGKISIHKMALSKHINRVHKQLEKSYHCHICDKSFGEKRTLKQHISKVHRDHKTYNEYM